MAHDRINVQNNPVNLIDPLGLVSAGQLGIGNPGSYGGENDCESMYDEKGPWYFSEIIDLEYNYYGPLILAEIPIGPGKLGKLKDVERIATSKNIDKLQKLVDKWGGKGKNWRKMKGTDAQGREWHWYQKRGDGTKYGLKPAGEPDPF